MSPGLRPGLRCLSTLFEAGRSPATASMVVAAVRFQARLTGSESPVGPRTDRVLAGYRRAARDRGTGQVAGVRWSQANAAAAVAANGGDSIHGLRDGAIIAVASDAMLRVSELSALCVGDIATDESGTVRRRLSARHNYSPPLETLIGHNYTHCIGSDPVGLRQVEVSWAEYELRRRVHFAP